MAICLELIEEIILGVSLLEIVSELVCGVWSQPYVAAVARPELLLRARYRPHSHFHCIIFSTILQTEVISLDFTIIEQIVPDLPSVLGIVAHRYIVSQNNVIYYFIALCKAIFPDLASLNFALRAATCNYSNFIVLS